MSNSVPSHPPAGACAVYGTPPERLAAVARGARQVSPLILGSEPLEELADGSLGSMTVAAPAGVVERRYILAQALRALRQGGRLVALAPGDRGGRRLRPELEAFGCVVAEVSRGHQRICSCLRPQALLPLAFAIEQGGLRWRPELGLWSQPGIFSWNRIDAGSAALMIHLGGLAGAGADLGCGTGVLALAALASPLVARLTLVDIDARAISAARRNVADARARFLQADLKGPMAAALHDLDFIVMNPPFHDGGVEDRRLGQSFIRCAAAALKRGGVCRMVANVALPYSAELRDGFEAVRVLAEVPGYKVWEARR